MNRRFCCLFLIVTTMISSVVVASAAVTDEQAKVRAAVYTDATAGVAELGVRTSATAFVTDESVMGLALDAGLLAGSENLSINQLAAAAQLQQDEAIRAQEAAEAAAEARRQILATYDGVMITSSASVRSGPGTGYGVVRSIASGKVAHLTGGDGEWFAVSYGTSTGYVEAASCQPVMYADYEGTAATSTVREDLVSYARTFIGTPYRYGGSSRSGTDCSGFTMQVFAAFGYSLPHSATAQYYRCTPVTGQERQAGDLVFFNTEGGISHVGVYIGGGAFVHASTSRGVIISYLSESYYAACYIGAGRIINE